MDRPIVRATVLLDPLLLGITFYAAYSIRTSLLGAIQPLSFYFPFLAISIGVFAAAGALFSLYSPSRVLFSLSYLSDFLRTYFLWAFCLILLPFLIKTDYARTIVFSYLIASFIVLYLARFVIAWITRTGSGPDTEITSAAHGILTMVQVTPDPLSLLENIRMARSSKFLYWATKRSLDIVGSGIALILLSPVFPYIAWRIRRDSPGPVIFTSKRVGKDGKEFTFYKFRSMYLHPPRNSPPRSANDSRITPFGKTLRRYSLDELPQLVNILRGEMSIVGPRPELPALVEKYAPWQKARLRAVPGLTGLWQILGRKDLPLDENLEYDLYYVFNQSFFLDCAIVLKTLPHLILPKGAY